MRLPVLLTANLAVVRDGLLFIEGGGWESYSIVKSPGFAVGFIAGIVELEAHEIDAAQEAVYRVVDVDGQVSGSEGSITMTVNRASILADGSVRCPFAAQIAVKVDRPGPFRVFIETPTGNPLGSTDFVVLVKGS